MTTDTCIPMNDESQAVSGKLDCGLFVCSFLRDGLGLGLDCFCFLSFVVPVESPVGRLDLLPSSFSLVI